MPLEPLARGKNAQPNGSLPVRVGGRRVDLADNHLDDAVEEFLFVRDVLV